MNTSLKHPLRTANRIAAFLLLAFLLVLTGCFETQRVFWSPDGKQAVVLGGDDGLLYLSDAQGNLSDQLLSNVETVAWFSDSRRLVLAREESYTNWSAISAVLLPEQRDTVRSLAERLLSQLESGKTLDQIGQDAKESDHPYLEACALYVRDEFPERLANALKNTTNNLDQVKAGLACLQTVRVDDRTIVPGPVLAREFSGVWNIRIAPNDQAIAYTTMEDELDVLALSVVPANGDQPAQLVDVFVSAYPDWTPDSQSLFYIRSASEHDSQKDLELASIVRRRVVDTNGAVNISNDTVEPAGLLFNPLAKVRCLRDGRIIFAAAELHLPATTDDMPQREQFFALDPQRQATLTPLVPRGNIGSLPESLAWFEVSPDEKQIVVGGEKSSVALFTIAGGGVAIVQPGSAKDTKIMPVWRVPDEFCYGFVFSRTNQTNVEIKTELALWQKGKPVILSTNWPEEVRKGLLK